MDEDLYKSLARIDKLEWDWQEAGGPSDTASNYAEAITRLPAKSAVGRWSDLGPRPRAGSEVLSKLTPENMNVTLPA